MIKLGSHVNNNGSEMLVGSLKEAVSYNANCFMVYLGAPQNSYRKPIEQLRVTEYKELLKEKNILSEDVIVHAPYIVNLATFDDEKRKYAIEFLSREVIGTYLIGSKYIVIHPGAHMNYGSTEGVARISDSLKQILENTKETDVVLCLETMAGKGTECCANFSEIASIIKNLNSPRVGVCFDTCHVFDSGYDIVNEYDKVLNEFDTLVGIDKIKLIHLNDSKNICGSHKDRHENVGFGNIGFDTLVKFVNDERFKNIVKILETPYVTNDKDEKVYPPYKYEIAMLRDNKFDGDLIKKIRSSK